MIKALRQWTGKGIEFIAGKVYDLGVNLFNLAEFVNGDGWFIEDTDDND